jgi:hypothetical protein
MGRIVIGLAILIGVGAYIRHQFHEVIRQATTRPSKSLFPTASAQPQESRRKCILCGGTGRAMQLNLGTRSPRNESCRACNGMGWVDNPLYRR